MLTTTCKVPDRGFGRRDAYCADNIAKTRVLGYLVLKARQDSKVSLDIVDLSPSTAEVHGIFNVTNPKFMTQLSGLYQACPPFRLCCTAHLGGDAVL